MSEVTAIVACDIERSDPASCELRGRGRPTKEVIMEQVTSFRPGNGTTYKNEQSPRMPVEFDLGQRAA